jgi:hypothetical protein
VTFSRIDADSILVLRLEVEKIPVIVDYEKGCSLPFLLILS